MIRSASRVRYCVLRPRVARVREFGVCVQSVSICANQPETERAALQEPRLLKILCLVPVVWLLECVFSTKAIKQKEKKKS